LLALALARRSLVAKVFTASLDPKPKGLLAPFLDRNVRMQLGGPRIEIFARSLDAIEQVCGVCDCIRRRLDSANIRIDCRKLTPEGIIVKNSACTPFFVFLRKHP
jgi:hypothetical protein